MCRSLATGRCPFSQGRKRYGRAGTIPARRAGNRKPLPDWPKASFRSTDATRHREGEKSMREVTLDKLLLPMALEGPAGCILSSPRRHGLGRARQRSWQHPPTAHVSGEVLDGWEKRERW